MDMPIKLLFVDDEQIMRDGLPLIWDWEAYGFQVVGSASNGKSALQICIRENPDIVITDIRMPVMDGLELTKELLLHNANIKIIILSAYDDFKYAQKAMSYGASEYLLKSEIEILIETILKLGKDVTVERENKIESEIEKKQSLNNIKRLQENLCWKLLSENVYEEKIEEQIKQHSLVLEKERLMILHIFGVINDDKLQKQLIDTDLFQRGYLLQSSTFHTIFLANVKIGKNIYAVEQRLYELHDGWKEEINPATNLIVSSIFTSFQNIYLYNRWLLEYSDTMIFYEKSGIFQMMDEKYKFEKLEMATNLFDIIQLGETNQFYKIGERIKEILENLSVCIHSVNDVKEMVRLLCLFLEQKKNDIESQDENINKDSENKREDSSKIYKSQTLVDLVIDTQEYCLSLLFIMEKNTKSYNIIVRKTIEYIYEHFNEPITLHVVAKETYCNATYLSQVFKKEVGVNFSDFLIQIRIKRALVLLTTTDLSITDIAEQVGIPNQSYFSRCVHKATGMQPSKYRQSQKRGGIG